MTNNRTKPDIIKFRGTAKYCWLTEPNKIHEKVYGTCVCDTIVPTDQAEKVKVKLLQMYEEEHKTRSEAEGKELKRAGFLLEDVEGGVLFRTKLKGGVKARDGKEYKFSVALFDAAGSPLPQDVQVWGGSEVIVAVTPYFWYTKLLGLGMTLELKAVQVLKLAEKRLVKLQPILLVSLAKKVL